MNHLHGNNVETVSVCFLSNLSSIGLGSDAALQRNADVLDRRGRLQKGDGLVHRRELLDPVEAAAGLEVLDAHAPLRRVKLGRDDADLRAAQVATFGACRRRTPRARSNRRVASERARI